LRRLPAGGLAAGLALAPVLVAPQGATPVATPAAPAAGGVTACGDPKAGQAVAFISTEGSTVGKLAITQVIDPFEGYTPDAPPPRGNHFVLVVLSVTNSGTQPLAIDPGRLFLQDTDGFVITPTGISRGNSPKPPDFPGGTVAPGATVTGAVGFAVLNQVKLARVFFGPSSERRVPLGWGVRGRGGVPPRPVRAVRAVVPRAAGGGAPGRGPR
jgi:hypothetical protein